MLLVYCYTEIYCNERPPVPKDHKFLAEEPTFQYMYSGPSLSGHSQQEATLSNVATSVCATTTNIFTSPSHHRPPL